MSDIKPLPTWSPSHKWGDGILLTDKDAEWLAYLAEELLAGQLPGADFATCRVESGMVAITFTERGRVVYLCVQGDRHPVDLAKDESVNLSDFVVGGWIAPEFDEDALPPMAARPHGRIPLARLTNEDVSDCVAEYNRMVADSKGGRRFRKKSWPDGLWRGIFDVMPGHDHLRLDIVPDGLTVVIATKRGATGTERVLRSLTEREVGGGWVYAQLDASMSLMPTRTLH